ncbi:MAG: hypothetical protein FWC27_00755, partial [Firmicutes bacterium]|nr:hypothetical protein [Bacillota bacterium]
NTIADPPTVTLDGMALDPIGSMPADEAAKAGLFKWDMLADGTLRIIVGEIPVDAVAEATFRVKVLPPAQDGPGSTRNIDNTASVQGKDTNTVRHVQALHDIGAVKFADPPDGATVSARKPDGTVTRITYFIQVTNLSGETKTGIVIEDTLPEGLVYAPGTISDDAGARGEADESGTAFRWVVDSLAPGVAVTVSFQAEVSRLPGGMPDGRDFVNSALADGYSTEAVTHHQYATSLRAEKFADPAPGPVEEDADITYTIEVENTGDADEFDLPVFDSLPEGTEYVPGFTLLTVGSWSTDDVDYSDADGESLAWTIPQLEIGQTALITFRAKVLPLPEGTGRRFISNQAQAGEGGQARTTNTVTHQQGELDLGIEKSADKTRVAQGGAVTYTITVTNGGGAAADIPVSDVIPEGMAYEPGSATQDENITCAETITDGAVTKLDWVIASLPNGETAEISFRVKAKALAAGVRSLLVDNTAEVNGADTNTVIVEVYSHLLSSIPPSGDTVRVGDIITYKISLYNAFENDLPALRVVDTLPPGTQFMEGTITGIGNGVYITAANCVEWNIEALPFGLTELTFQVRVLPEAAGGEIHDRALIYGYGDAAEETNEVFHPVALPELSAEKSADPLETELLQPGSTLTYFITVSNNTDSPMEGVPVLDVIPDGTSYVADSADHDGVYSQEDGNIKWTVGIAAQSEIVLSFRVTVDEFEGDQATITNRALYGEPGAVIPDIPTNQVRHTAAAEIVEPELFAEKIADRPETAVLSPGDELTYTITVYNYSDDAMAGVPVLDAIPAGTSYAPGSADNGGVYDAESKSILWTVGIAAQSEIELSFRVTVDGIAEGEVSIVNRAVYGPEDTLTNVVSHTARAEVPPPPPPFRAEKIANRPGTALLRPGDELTYTITVFNETDD